MIFITIGEAYNARSVTMHASCYTLAIAIRTCIHACTYACIADLNKALYLPALRSTCNAQCHTLTGVYSYSLYIASIRLARLEYSIATYKILYIAILTVSSSVYTVVSHSHADPFFLTRKGKKKGSGYAILV